MVTLFKNTYVEFFLMLPISSLLRHETIFSVWKCLAEKASPENRNPLWLKLGLKYSPQKNLEIFAKKNLEIFAKKYVDFEESKKKKVLRYCVDRRNADRQNLDNTDCPTLTYPDQARTNLT
jgi:hypothetical protein